MKHGNSENADDAPYFLQIKRIDTEKIFSQSRDNLIPQSTPGNVGLRAGVCFLMSEGLWAHT